MENKVVVIAEGDVRYDKYDNMFFKDKEGKEYKIGAKRDDEVRDTVVANPGRAVELIYSNFMNKDFISDVKLFEGKPPVANKPMVEGHLAQEAIKQGGVVEDVKSKYKADPNKTASIELQVCLKAATDLSVALINAGILKEKITERTISTFNEFKKLF